MTNKRFSGKWYIITLVLTLLLMCGTGVLTAAQPEQFDYEFFSFKNISAEQGLKYLAETKIVDISRLPNSPTLLVTSSNPDNLKKAKVIKDLIDCREEYAVRIIPSMIKELPNNKQIMDNIGTIAIGNFANPPAADGNARTIVDICNNNLIIIAPLKMADRIIKTIEKLQANSGQGIVAGDSNSKPYTLNPNSKAGDRGQGIENLNPKPYTLNPNSNPVQSKSNLFAANQPIDPLSIPNPEDEVVLNLSDQLTLIEFIGWVGPYLKMDFMYNTADFDNQNVTINPNGVLKGRIKIKDLYNYLDAVLQFKGFAMTRGTGNLVTIVKRDSVLSINPVITQSEQTVAEAGDSVRIDFFELKNISTATAEDLIKKMQLSIQITSIPENKTLMITEYTSRMPRIRALLDMVDKPGEPKQFRYKQLQYTMAQTLAPKIQSLAGQLGTISITISTTASGSPGQPERPIKRQEESDAAFNARLRSWEAQMRQISLGAATPSPAPSASPGAPASSTVFLDSDERTNRILMIGLKKQLDEVEELINTLDVSQRDPRKLQIYKIEYLDAEEVMKKLEELNIIPVKNQTSGDSSRTRTTQPPRITGGETAIREPLPAPTTVSPAKGEGGALEAVGEEPLVVLVASTNSLLVHASEEQHARIVAIINLVDKERIEIPFRIYKLKNADPAHLEKVLKQLVEETIRDKDDKIQSVVAKQDEVITIVADANTSSLIVNANKKNQDWIETLIKVLDKRRPQVLIDVTLVQISKTDVFDYDLNLISSIPDLTDTSGLTNAILSSTSKNLVQPLAGSSGSRGHFLDFQSDGGQGTGFYGDKHINALLKLMEQKDYGRVMAKPKILVNDNQPGFIETKDVTYVTKTSSIPVSGGAGGSNTDLIQTEIDYAPYDAGISLEITPHISESDLLRLDIKLVRKDFGTITGERPPDTTDSTVETIVTVPDGSTIILGGLLKMNQSKGGTKIPFLGDLPFVGPLFRSVSNSDMQRNLYVFVKAEIIRPPDEDNTPQVDLERISRVNREAFEKYEDEFQGYKSFPGFKPTPMGPAKVLDAQ